MKSFQEASVALPWVISFILLYFSWSKVLSARRSFIRCIKTAVFSSTSFWVYVPFNKASASKMLCVNASKLSSVYPSREMDFAAFNASFNADVSTFISWRLFLAFRTSFALSFISEVHVSSSFLFRSSLALLTAFCNLFQLSSVYLSLFSPSQIVSSSSNWLRSTISFFSVRIFSVPTSTHPLFSGDPFGLFPTRSNWIV